MALLRYVGPIDEVYVPSVGVLAQRDGEPVDIPDAAVAASLLEQETWVAVTPAPAAVAAPKTAAKEA